MPTINHVFVLMLENQSFDRLLGQSGITGHDPKLNATRAVNGSNSRMTNTHLGITYPVTSLAPWSLTVDPRHEFEDVFEQLTGKVFTNNFDPRVPYPIPTNSGFVQNFATLNPAPAKLGDIMSGYAPEQLPVLNTLAKKFAVCDQWFSSLPGPTWPNRFFLHGGSSGGLDHSPSGPETAEWEIGIPGGFEFQNGNIYDQLKTAGISFRFYRGDKFLTDDYPNVAAFKGIKPTQSHPISQFARDVNSNYDIFYTFIEPSYGNVIKNTYAGGTSQHPMDDVRGGEALIKQVYEAIRNSPVWSSSLLVITWDEHGGFFDHVIPPAAVPPGDTQVTPGQINRHGFTFNQYGVRVPAVVVSPWVPENTVDGTRYDHSSIPSTLRGLKGQLRSLTNRDAQANNVLSLLSLAVARTDAPTSLPNPSTSVIPTLAAATPALAPQNIHHGSLPGFAYLALRTNLADVADPLQRQNIKDQFNRIITPNDMQQFFQQVKGKADNSTA